MTPAAVCDAVPIARVRTVRAALAMVVASGILLGGETTAQSATSTPTVAEILRHLERDLFLAPGRGLKRVRLGQRLADVLTRWGRPARVGRRGLLGREKRFAYKAGDDTVVIVSGRKRVESIEIRGTLTSPFETTEGVRFGMAPYQVQTIYGAADRSEPGRLEYRRRGITFEFEGGTVRAMSVFRPGTS